MREYAEAVPVASLADHFADPPRRFGPIGFWFLNDRCDPVELTRQLEEFAAAGYGGVSPCARIGLDPEVGYLTERWFDVMDHVMAQCQRLGLRVILYDEASYPSGSANGEVVAANPEHMARGLVLGDSVVTIDGELLETDPTTAEAKQVWTSSPKTTWTRESAAGVVSTLRQAQDDAGSTDVGYWRPTTGRSLMDRLVAVVAGELDDQDRVKVDTVRPVRTGEHNLVRLDRSELPGRWRLMAVFDVPSGGTIRGAYAHNDDGSALAPAASNLLDPAAVASFVQITHGAYARHLGKWFGDPIVGLFTDEPHLLGRGHRRDARPWTPALVDDLTADPTSSVDDVLVMLPSLFVPYDDDHGFDAHFRATVADRQSRVYYGAQRRWCDDHGLALTGHPSEPDELTALDNFTWPGQDAVWRWVLPGGSALHGRESATARSSSSVAQHRGVRTVLTEVFGAYGWRLSMDEVKWLLDWHLVRGTTAFLLHALFESVRGNRAFESEPDLGLHNAWWPHFPAVADYLRRASMVVASLERTADVAVLVVDDRAPTDAVAELYRHQITFDYVTPHQLRTARDRYRAVAVPDGADTSDLGLATHRLDDDSWWLPYAPTDVTVTAGTATDLRLARLRAPRGTTDWLLLTNEGETQLEARIPADMELWDLWTGDRRPGGGVVTLDRRGSALVAPAGISGPLQTTGTTRPAPSTPIPLPGGSIPLEQWQVSRVDGHVWSGPRLGNWTDTRELETWSGSVRYRTVVTLAEPPTGPLALDLGQVGELARVEVNGHAIAELLWPPYRTVVDPGVLQVGDNVIEVVVTNSSANSYEGARRPSGLIGPVQLG